VVALDAQTVDDSATPLKVVRAHSDLACQAASDFGLQFVTRAQCARRVLAVFEELSALQQA